MTAYDKDNLDAIRSAVHQIVGQLDGRTHAEAVYQMRDELLEKNARLREALEGVTDPADCDCSGDATSPGIARCGVCDAVALLRSLDAEPEEVERGK